MTLREKRADRSRRLKIGDVARQSGVSVESLRFYENRGLIEPAGRTEAGYRLYDSSVFERLSFIKKAQKAGFTLDEIAWIIAEARQGRRPCAEVRVIARNRLAELERTLAELARYRDELKQTIEAWDQEGEKDGLVCGLIEGLRPNELHPPEPRPGSTRARNSHARRMR